MINSIIVDDEMPAREELKYLLEDIEEVNVVGEAANGIEALRMNKELKPDLIFLDIQMPQINGIEVVEKIMQEENIPIIIFVTAYDEFAVKAFEVNAVDYLLKPVQDNRLYKSINKVLELYQEDKEVYNSRIEKMISEIQNKSSTRMNRISVIKLDKIIPLNLDEIIYATIEGRDTIIYSLKGKFDYKETLTELYNMLNTKKFFRCHRSYIVNIDYIKEIEPWFNGTYQIRMENSDELIPVSRNKIKKFKEIMNIK